MSTDILSKKLHRWKTNLIDLSKRNRLLNFKDNVSAVIKFNSNINEIYNLLSNDKMIKVSTITDIQKFIEKEKKARRKKLDLEHVENSIRYDDIEEGALEKLENSLQSIRLKAKSSLDEKGVNTLFITFGQLIWKESKDSNIELRSPLLLLPVTLSRESSDKPYFIERYDDDLTLNPTLLQKIRIDFGITLPSLEEDAEINLQDYIQLVTEAVKNNKEWSVTQESYLGFFSFSKMVMYKDLEQFVSQISQHELIQKLAGVTKELQKEASDLESIRTHDKTLKSVESFQILDADSSQQEAILAANNGKSFIISGPPGTGKSQTIANIIAESIAKGKKVLFVSEKKAALEVVKKRLDSQLLGDFCLELHSNNANKKYVLGELHRTLSLQHSPRLSHSSFDMFDKIKMLLNNYTEALHTKVEPLNLTSHRVHGELSKLDHVDDLTFSIENIRMVNQNKLDEIYDLLDRLGLYVNILKDSKSHIWSGSNVKRFSFELQSDITVKFKKLSSSLKIMSGILATLIQELETAWTASPDGFSKLQSLNEMLKQIPLIPEEWLRIEEKFNYNASLYEQAIRKFEEYQNAKEAATIHYVDDVYKLDADDVLSNLNKSKSDLEALLQSSEEFINQLAGAEYSYLHGLKTLRNSLIDLQSTTSNTSTYLGIDFHSVTIDMVTKMKFILDKIKCHLRPTHHWFESDSSEKLEQVLKEAKTNIQQYLEDMTTFNVRYDRQLLDRPEHEGMLDRFMMKYTNFFRIFMKTYRNDQKVFNFYSKLGSKPKYNELLNDVKLVARLLDKKKWIEKENESLKRWLGEHYKGTDTDWQLLSEQIHQVQELNEFVTNNQLPYDKIKSVILDASINDIEMLDFQNNKMTNALSVMHQLILDIRPILKKELSNEVNRVSVEESIDYVNKIIITADTFIAAKENMFVFARQVSFTLYDKLVEDLVKIQTYKLNKDGIEQDNELFSAAFGSLFEGFNTNWETILIALEWTKKLKQLTGGTVPDAIVRIVITKDHLIPEMLNKQVEETKKRIYNNLTLMQFYNTIFPEDAAVFEGKTYKQSEYSVCADRLELWANESYKLEEWIAVQQILLDANSLGISEFVQQIKDMSSPERVNMRSLFLKRFYKMWLDYAYEVLPNLAHFNVEQHSKLIVQFKNLDKSQLDTNGSRIHAILNTNKKSVTNDLLLGSQVRTLNKEVAKKSRHKSIRNLFVEIPDLIFALKPCVMMSPMSVSQFIDPNIVQFDTVIFDEASQLCTEDAVGSIFRGKQIIIAGDKKQLPPTKFFGTSVEEDEEFLDEEDETNDTYESVLEEASIFMKVQPLQWHYRSKHESLIAFSNKEIYDDQLYTFPSSSNRNDDGVSLVYVHDGLYERSTSRRNLIEAKTVAKLVFEHIEKSPERSLGVIAFSEAQQQAILDQIQALRKLNREYEDFFDDSKSDYFFVKNLENVQGDERDTIFFSVGYGKDSNGVIHYNFGPLNKPGGERRLNVAVTRAKHEIKLISSILHSDLDDSKLTKRGPQLLKSYLYYASTGGDFSANTGIQNDGEFDSPLEEDVYEALTSHGLMLRKQVGCSSYRIDLAVVDPKKPGNYLLGIECDGAAYHSSKTARDRDRLRQEILESLGWKIHRIWSQDWFRRKQDEIAKILRALRDMSV